MSVSFDAQMVRVRPLDTFAAEGWYRPSRVYHYYRAGERDKFHLGPDAVTSICGKWGSGGGIRPYLKALTDAKRCRECEALLAKQFARTDGGWFERELLVEGVAVGDDRG